MLEGVYSYGHVKTLTEQLVSEALSMLDAPPNTDSPLTQSHELIRSGTDYAELFSLGSQKSATLTSTQPETQIEATL